MKHITLLGLIILMFETTALCSIGASTAGSWREWRGDGTGVSTENNIQIAWDRTKNILWKAVIPGEGSSSPIVNKDKVFLTSSSDSGKVRHILCFDASKGTLLWDTKVKADKVGVTHPYSGYAAPTPTTDGRAVYAFFESPGLVAVDYSGNLLWTSPIGPIDNIYNLASSPIIADDSIVVPVDHNGESFIEAVNKSDGKVRWRTKRPASLNYSTPIVVSAANKTLALMNGTTICAYDLVDGTEVWSCKGMTDAVTPSPVQMDGNVLCASGRNGPVFIIDPNGNGDVSETCILSQIPTGGAYVVSPIAAYGLYTVPNDDGTLRVYDRTGTFLFEHRFPGQFSASPVAVDGYLLWTSERGDTYVFKIGSAENPAFDFIRINKLGERIVASPAIADKRLYIRSVNQLYCIFGDQSVPYKPKPDPPTPNFEDLKELIESHPGIEEGDPNIAIRVELVDKIGRIQHPDAPAFLKTIIMEDHWDVSENAMRSLAKQGEYAVPILLELITDYRQWIRTIACQALGTIGKPETLQDLVKATGDTDPSVRIAALQAIVSIENRNPQYIEQTLKIVETLLRDPQGVVRASAVRTTLMLSMSEEQLTSVIRLLKAMQTDASPIVSANVKSALNILDKRITNK